MTEIALSGVKSIQSSIHAQTPLTLSSDSAKSKEATLPDRRVGVPPGASRSIEENQSKPSPVQNFINEEVIKESLPEQSSSQKLRGHLIDTVNGINDQRDKQLEKLRENLPQSKIREIIREGPREKEEIEEKIDSEDSTELVNAQKAKAAKSYQLQSEQSRNARESVEKKPELAPREESSRNEPPQKEQSNSRVDVAAGGASAAQKGSPNVNFVA